MIVRDKLDRIGNTANQIFLLDNGHGPLPYIFKRRSVPQIRGFQKTIIPPLRYTVGLRNDRGERDG
jgi:hypothetical protein